MQNYTQNYTQKQSDRLEDVLEDWYKIKKEMSYLNQMLDKYKRIIDDEIYRNGTQTISSGEFSVTRKTYNKRFLKPSLMPKDLFYKYSTNTEYDVYHLRKNKSKKNS